MARTARRLRVARERGAGSVEFTGLLMIVALCVTVGTSALGGALSEQGVLVSPIERALCDAETKAMQLLGLDPDECTDDDSADDSDEDPEEAAPADLPPCISYRQDRILGGNVTAFGWNLEATGKDQLYTTVDPDTGEERAYVVLGNEGGIGPEAGNTTFGDLEAEGSISVQSGTGVVYEFDSRERAEDFLDDHRGSTVQRLLGAVPGASTVEGILTTGGEAVEEGLSWIGIGDGGDEEEVPSGVTVSLGAQADGSVSYEGAPTSSLEGTADLEGQISAAGREAATFRFNFDGSSTLSVRYDGEIGLAGNLGVSEDLRRRYPWLSALGIGQGRNFNGAVEYRIQFDDGFHPTRFQLITERGESTTGRVGTDNANSGGSEGDLTVNTYTLDLENEENQEAVLETLPFVAASQFVSPALPVALLTTDNPLSDRLTENSVEYEQRYETEGDTLAAQTPTSGDEVGEQSSGFGIGGNDETARRTLTSTRYRDNGQPDAVWQDADCSDSGSSDDD